MKRHLIVAASLVSLTSYAIAADLPFQKEPVSTPVSALTWSGVYAGLNAGYGWGTSNQAGTLSTPITDTTASTVNAVNVPGFPGRANYQQQSALLWGGTALANTAATNVQQGGFVGGGQIGYNYQYSHNFVLGVETDFQGSTISGNGSYQGLYQDSWRWATPNNSQFINLNRSSIGLGSVSGGVDWLGTVRGRIGFLPNPMLLIYGTGGFAYGAVRASATNALLGSGTVTTDDPLNIPVAAQSLPGSGSYSGLRSGWTAGGGLEWMFIQNWSIKTEALYYSLGTASFNSSPVVALSQAVPLGLIPLFQSTTISNLSTSKVSFDGVIARAGINYHFNSGAAPIISKF